MKKIYNLENQNGEYKKITRDEISYITKYIYSVFDEFISSVCPQNKLDLITDDVKRKLVEYISSIFCKFFDAYKSNNSEDVKVQEEVKYLSHGHFSFAFKVGDIVIKIGFSSSNTIYKPVDSNYILNTLFYEKVKIGDHLYFMTSVLPYVEIRDFSLEELYEVYKGLRNDGFIWNDIKSENIGVLAKDGVINIDGMSYPLLKEGQRVGDIVIIDLDDISDIRGFSPEIMEEILDEICFNGYNKYTYLFETKYRQEDASKRE